MYFKKVILAAVSVLCMIFFVNNQSLAENLVPVARPILKPVLGTPPAPDLDVKAYIVIDANSGYVIAEKNADAKLPPASMTKLMTLYLTANALKAKQIHFQDSVTISQNARSKEGSRMYVEGGSQVSVGELINGIVIASGNDATVAMAEYLAGTEENFVAIMNQTAAKLGMTNTHFVDSNGLPEPQHYSSARDLSILARSWIDTFPEYYPWFKQKWIMFHKIKQNNRNLLLWRDPSVDGMKTGHTDEAQYCLVASALRNGMRLIAVVMAAPSDSARLNDTEALLNYGFRYFETHKVFVANKPLPFAAVKVWFGKQSKMLLGLDHDFYVTVPTGEYNNLKAKAILNDKLKAPITKGQVGGTLTVMLNGKAVAAAPLVALEDNPRDNFIMLIFDYIAWVFHKIF